MSFDSDPALRYLAQKIEELGKDMQALTGLMSRLIWLVEDLAPLSTQVTSAPVQLPALPSTYDAWYELLDSNLYQFAKRLSPRERVICASLMANFYGRKATGKILLLEIANALYIEERTASSHMDHIRIKFELESRDQIVPYVISKFYEHQWERHGPRRVAEDRRADEAIYAAHRC